ncbi:MAG: hypothetical protein ACLQMO_10045 [Acidobacteriaceae bacterium]
MKDANQQFRLRRFWGAAIFSLGTLWGFANFVYFPVAALTSIVGSSWLEVFIIFAGGALTFIASILAFYHRQIASRLLLSGGFFLLVFAIGGQFILPLSTRGILNLLLLFLSGAVAIALGLFGTITDRKGWPTLRDLP